MTTEERATQMTERNKAICARYLDGHKLKDVASRFGLGRQQTMNILVKAGVWKPYEKGSRTKFLGVNVSEGTKEGLIKKAEDEGVSVSKFVSDRLDAAVAAECSAELKVCVNGDYVLDFLEAASGAQVTLKFKDAKSAMLMLDGDDHVGVVMLLRSN